MNFRATSALAFAILLFCANVAPLLADDDGALTPEFSQSLRNTVTFDGPTRALHNALTGSDARRLAIDRAIVQANNDLFNHKVKTKGITDQKGSGRCWMFAAMNTMRPAVIEKYKLDEFEFSLSYLAFWDKLEKANFFLETMIDFRDRDCSDREYDFFVKDPINDGGWWVFVVALIEKYGVVPKDVMPETLPSQFTDTMNKILETKLRAGAAQLRRMAAEKKSLQQLREAKRKMLAEIYRVLVLNYGQPPTEFTYRYADRDKKIIEPKKYTPQSFYKEWVGVDLSQYVHLVNDPTQPYAKHFRIRRIRGMFGAAEVNYVNVPIDVIKSVVTKSIVDNQAPAFSCDAGKDMDAESGIMQAGFYDFTSIYGVDLTLGKADRLRTRGGGPDHCMVFIGVDIQNNKPTKWLVENSWGPGRGKNGLMTMYDKWFDEHVYDTVVRKAYVPNEVLKVFQEEPIELPPWYPLNTSPPKG
jgi:bleomycin hydrolase